MGVIQFTNFLSPYPRYATVKPNVVKIGPTVYNDDGHQPIVIDHLRDSGDLKMRCSIKVWIKYSSIQNMDILVQNSKIELAHKS